MGTDWKNISLKELAATIYKHLNKHGIASTLVGGACVSIYTRNKYQSYDLDFVTHASMGDLAKCLKELGFVRKSGRHFEHPLCAYFIEFVNPPVSIGGEVVTTLSTIRTNKGEIRLLTPTDCVKDRLAAYFFWKDYQSLQQALDVAQSQKINLEGVKRWAAAEGQLERCGEFLRKLRGKSLSKRKSRKPVRLQGA